MARVLEKMTRRREVKHHPTSVSATDCRGRVTSCLSFLSCAFGLGSKINIPVAFVRYYVIAVRQENNLPTKVIYKTRIIPIPKLDKDATKEQNYRTLVSTMQNAFINDHLNR